MYSVSYAEFQYSPPTTLHMAPENGPSATLLFSRTASVNDMPLDGRLLASVPFIKVLSDDHASTVFELGYLSN